MLPSLSASAFETRRATQRQRGTPMALFDSPGITATVLIAGAAALRFLSVSPQLLLIIGLVTLFLLAGSQPSGGAEQFSPHAALCTGQAPAAAVKNREVRARVVGDLAHGDT